MKQALEGSSELDVEDGVDDRVEETVDVAQPDEERQKDGVDAADGQRVEQIVAQTDGVDDVQREERDPTQQEHSCRIHTDQCTRASHPGRELGPCYLVPCQPPPCS